MPDDDLKKFEPIHTRAFFKRPQEERPQPLPLCGIKHSYISKRVAEKMRMGLIETKRVRFLRTYKCPKCAYFHLTSKKQRKYAKPR